jgi:DNA-directed RNA polymerase beta' subunit
MVKYDGTARTSREHIIQFVYGEDGMSAENIENLSIDKFVKTNDVDMGKKFKFISNDSGASKY